MTQKHTIRSFLLTVFLAVAGCSSEKTAPVPESHEYLRAISSAYIRWTQNKNVPPANSEDLKSILKEMGNPDPDKILVSPNDNEPYVIHWNVDFRQFAGNFPVLAYEKTGKNGQHYVLRMRDIQQVTAEELKKLPFPKGYSPPK